VFICVYLRFLSAVPIDSYTLSGIGGTRSPYTTPMASPRWLWLDFTDPHFQLTREQRREIRQRAKRIRLFDRPIFTAGMPLSNEVRQARLRRRSSRAILVGRLPIIAIYLIWLVFVFITPRLFQQGPPHLVAIVVGISAVSLWVVTSWIGYVLARPWYRYAMYELGYEICAECGYPLHGLDDSTHCPECGWRKTHRGDLPPVQWTETDRNTLREHGYEVCSSCGGLLMERDQRCPRCGEHHPSENPA